MSAPFLLEPPPDFVDPRLRPDFRPEHWPLCDGVPASPPDTAGLHERRCIEFLASFYQLNLLNGRLLQARNNGVSEAAIRRLLDEIAAATDGLEKVEDRYAPIGFFGEPVMDGVFYRDITFVRPELPRIYPQPASYSSHIAIPGLEEIPESELRGPAKIIRFGYGEVDF